MLQETKKKKIAKDGCVMQSSYFVTIGAGGNMAHSGFDQNKIH